MNRRAILGLSAITFGLLGAQMAVASTPHDHSSHHHPADLSHTDIAEVDGGHLGILGDDDLALFWQTPEVACSDSSSPENLSGPQSCDDTSFTWTFDLANLWAGDGSAQRLRIDFDQPYRQDDFELVVTDPDDETVTQASSNTYTHGVTISPAPGGTYTVTLNVLRTNGTKVRVRAGIVPPAADDQSDIFDEHGDVIVDDALLPNLRVTPPLEIGFAAPINPANSTFMAGDDQNPGVIVGDETLYSCTADEIQEAADPSRYPADELTVLTDCLRFTTGPHNIGDGHFDLRFPILSRATAGNKEQIQEMTQFIHRSGGDEPYERPAGFYEYHPTHGHWHYLDILYYELLSVDVDARTVENIGVGHKSGFCPADQGYGDWWDFDQDPKNAASAEQGANCFALTGDGAIGLTAGWGDFYRWQRPGQFVDFSGQPDGRYVVRATVDVLGHVLESNEDDNSSYAYVQIEGSTVTLLERGYGDSPFDPDKVLAEDNRGLPQRAGLTDYFASRSDG